MLLKDLSIEEKNCIASDIQFNIKAEAEASEYYFNLLNKVAEEDQKTIKDIIADELNHSIILAKLQEKYTGVLPSEYEPILFLKKKEEK